MLTHIRSDVPLAPFNTFGVAARARRFVRIESIDALHELRACREWDDLPRLVLGSGSNVLFTRDFDGLVVHVATRGHEHLGDDGSAHLVAVEAGESWDGFVRTTLRAGWPGLENLALIPGTVGASPVQNVGAYGVELAERFAWLEAFEIDTGRIRRMDATDCAFGYRDSVFKQALAGKTVITRVVFRLPIRWEARIGYGDVAARLAAAGHARPTPEDVADVVTAIRREKLPDPSVAGNAGSFFKNPIVADDVFEALRASEPGIVGHRQHDGRVKLAAAWLIDRSGWRGRSLGTGGAAVHDRQALVIVNRGGATGAEIVALATAIRDSVLARYDVALEPEPLIV